MTNPNEECAWCNGKGKVPGKKKPYRLKDCRDCDGTGITPEPKIYEPTIDERIEYLETLVKEYGETIEKLTEKLSAVIPILRTVQYMEYWDQLPHAMGLNLKEEIDKALTILGDEL